ncbi:MAG: hypothetical protein D6798_09080 [Deltaproteobacteria bacterium]|nr:MAG: hypothetical protein D6798_09080 [Deltaproteobacteria bacterium]
MDCGHRLEREEAGVEVFHGKLNPGGWVQLESEDKQRLTGLMQDGWARADEDYIYMVCLADDSVMRAVGCCPVLYVGHGQLRRVEALTEAKHSSRGALGRFARAWASRCRSLAVEIIVKAVGGAGLREVLHLTHIARDHGEMPPANLRWEGYLSGRVIRACAKWATDPEADRRWLSCVYEWDDGNPVAAWVDVHDRDGQRVKEWVFSLGWVWSKGLLEHAYGDRPPVVPAQLQGRIILLDGGKGSTAGYGVGQLPGHGAQAWTSCRVAADLPAEWLENTDRALVQAQLGALWDRPEWHPPRDAVDTLAAVFDGLPGGSDYRCTAS